MEPARTQHVKEKVEIEINNTDSLIITKKDTSSGGSASTVNQWRNHPDFLGIALSQIGNVSERRVERLVNSQLR